MSKSKDGKTRSERGIFEKEKGQNVTGAQRAAEDSTEVGQDSQDKKEKKRKREDADKDEKKSSKKLKKSKGQDGMPVKDAPLNNRKKDKTDKKCKKRITSNEDEASAKIDEELDEKVTKKIKKDKKSKKKSKGPDSVADTAPLAAEENGTGKTPAKDASTQDDFIRFEDDPSFEIAYKSKDHSDANGTNGSKPGKNKKAEKKAAKDKKHAKDTVDTAADGTEGTDGSPGEIKNRFIVFVGNLPFSATKEQIQSHFAKIEPIDIRIMTDKKSGKPKGFAFVEFDRFDRMETCLKKYQHSLFSDGDGGSRKINIELTVGGGGNTSARKSKIHAKNEKLQDERQREREKRDETEAKQQERKDKKEARQPKGKKKEPAAEGGSDEASAEHGGIHPSRLAMMQGPQGSGWNRHKRY